MVCAFAVLIAASWEGGPSTHMQNLGVVFTISVLGIAMFQQPLQWLQDVSGIRTNYLVCYNLIDLQTVLFSAPDWSFEKRGIWY